MIPIHLNNLRLQASENFKQLMACDLNSGISQIRCKKKEENGINSEESEKMPEENYQRRSSRQRKVIKTMKEESTDSDKDDESPSSEEDDEYEDTDLDQEKEESTDSDKSDESPEGDDAYKDPDFDQKEEEEEMRKRRKYKKRAKFLKKEEEEEMRKRGKYRKGAKFLKKEPTSTYEHMTQKNPEEKMAFSQSPKIDEKEVESVMELVTVVSSDSEKAVKSVKQLVTVVFSDSEDDVDKHRANIRKEVKSVKELMTVVSSDSEDNVDKHRANIRKAVKSVKELVTVVFSDSEDDLDKHRANIRKTVKKPEESYQRGSSRQRKIINSMKEESTDSDKRDESLSSEKTVKKPEESYQKRSSRQRKVVKSMKEESTDSDESPSSEGDEENEDPDFDQEEEEENIRKRKEMKGKDKKLVKFVKKEPMSAYELMIQKNREEKMAFLQSLNIDEAKTAFVESTTKKKVQPVKRKFKNVERIRSRKSKRLENVKMDLSERKLYFNAFNKRAGEKPKQLCSCVMCPNGSTLLVSHQPPIDEPGRKSKLLQSRMSRNFFRNWTNGEQKKLDDLLIKFPPEENENSRWEKISKHFKNRTPRQVANRVSYLKKLMQDGKFVPGKIPGIQFNEISSEEYTRYNHGSNIMQYWTPEEQKRLEELLIQFPPEKHEFQRWRKIANFFPNRTPAQVGSRAKTYFVMLKRCGMPVPGKLPRTFYRAKKKGRMCRAISDHSFFFHCDLPSSTVGNPVKSETNESVEKDINEELERMEKALEEKQRMEKPLEEKQISSRLGHIGYKCSRCTVEPIMGVRWHCTVCKTQSVDFCSECCECEQLGIEGHSFNHPLEGIQEATQ